MKSLQESLFDDDLARRSICFGDMYKPNIILFGERNLKLISAEFDIKKLKKDIKPMSLDGIKGCEKYKALEKEYPFLPYVLAKVAELPLDEKFVSAKSDGNFVSYSFKLSDMFRDYLKLRGTRDSWRKQIKITFIMSKWNLEPCLQIRKAASSVSDGLRVITINYKAENENA